MRKIPKASVVTKALVVPTILSLLCAPVLAVCLSPAFAQAVEDDAAQAPQPVKDGTIASGTWGTCPWEIDSEGTLTVHPGEGGEAHVDAPVSPGGEYTDDPPHVSYWEGYSDDITSIVFAEEDGQSVIAPADSSYLFCGLSAAESADLSGLDTSNVENMSAMFRDCSSLRALDLSSFDTSSVEGMGEMFIHCSSLKTLDLSCFDTSSVVEMFGMFWGCSALETVYASDGWTVDAVETIIWPYRVFSGCTSLVGGNGTVYSDTDPANNIEYARIDAPGTPGCLTRKESDSGNIASGTWGTCPWEINVDGVLTVHPGEGAPGQGPWSYQDFSDYITTIVFVEEGRQKIIVPEESSSLFSGLSKVTSIDFSGLDTSNVAYMYAWFANCTSLVSVDFSGLDTSNVTVMQLMFARCSSLVSINFSGIDTSKVTMMDNMFDGCSSLTSLDLFGFDTSKVESMAGMFWSCSSLESLDLSGFDTSSLKQMGGHPLSAKSDGMFAGCASLRTLDLSSFDTSGVINMYNLFRGCAALTTIYAGDGWSTAGLEGSSYTAGGDNLFAGCTKLVGENGTKYSASHTDATYARIDAPGSPGYLSRKVPAQELAGAGRYDTAATIAIEAYPADEGGASGVVIATGKDFPDALGASALAGMLDYPILLTEPGSLSQATREAIGELGATEAIVVGGTGAVSDKVFGQLQGMLGDDAVTRVAGKDRYKTAEAVYRYGLERGEWGTTAIVATGRNYPDALSISGYAFSYRAPIFLCDPAKGLSKESRTALESGGFAQVIIVGGTGAVPEGVETWARDSVTPNVDRLAGKDRYETSRSIASFGLAAGCTVDGACIATGANFPDALAGGVLVGKANTVLLLADPGKTTTLSILEENAAEVEHIYYLGGIGAVPQVVRRAAEEAAGFR